MDLNKHFIKTKRPCAEGFRWFLKHCEKGADYQPLLDALVAAGRVNDACWLLDQFGPTGDMMTVDAIEADAFVFAGTLDVRGNVDVSTVLRAGGAIRTGHGIDCGGDIDCAGHLEAGWGIRAGGAMRAQGAIRAGESLQAADIAAGEGYGVYAGLMVRQDSWDSSARVWSPRRPERLFSGCWVCA